MKVWNTPFITLINLFSFAKVKNLYNIIVKNLLIDVVVIGGGLAGLTSAILLKKAGLKVVVVEKNRYPHHKVCGEYISNEAKPFLEKHRLLPTDIALPEITTFTLSSTSGKTATAPLDLGGFGVSRYLLDEFIYKRAVEEGVIFHLQKQARQVNTHPQHYDVQLSDGTTITASLVIGAHGKRSVLDKTLDREFLKKRSGFIGVKYHIATDYPAGSISLHNFEGGYCGISKIEGDKYNLCYLGRREDLKKYGSVREMEQNILYKNPLLKQLFETSDFLFEEPLVINAFSFEKKKAIEKDVLMAGDAAGLITPLCGNGMAMAIHSAKVLSEIIISKREDTLFQRAEIFSQYEKLWRHLFALRLWTGRTIQNLFGNRYSSELAVQLMKRSPWISRQIIKNTHGLPF